MQARKQQGLASIGRYFIRGKQSVLFALFLTTLGCESHEFELGQKRVAPLGIWVGREVPGGPILTMQFEKSGRYSIEWSEDEKGMGQYDVSDKVMSIERNLGASRERVKYSFFADERTLFPTAYNPKGTHDGPIGTWESRWSSQKLGGDGAFFSYLKELELRVDGSATLRVTDAFGNVSIINGNYQPYLGPYVDGHLEAYVFEGKSGEPPDDYSLPFVFLDGTALVEDMYCALRKVVPVDNRAQATSLNSAEN